VRYYSWSGTVRDTGDNAADPARGFCRAFSEYFITEAGQNDGIVGRFSSHLGKVIRSDYPMDHLDAINQSAGGERCKETDPVALYLRHAERLRIVGL
jgi:triacylglycerol lipase